MLGHLSSSCWVFAGGAPAISLIVASCRNNLGGGKSDKKSEQPEAEKSDQACLQQRERGVVSVEEEQLREMRSAAEVPGKWREGFEQQDRPRKPLLARNAASLATRGGDCQSTLWSCTLCIAQERMGMCNCHQFSSVDDLSRSEMQDFLRNAEKCENLGSFSQLPDSSVI